MFLLILEIEQCNVNYRRGLEFWSLYPSYAQKDKRCQTKRVERDREKDKNKREVKRDIEKMEMMQRVFGVKGSKNDMVSSIVLCYT